jgi:predicted DsbA family dithiol-disulfide isomerase
VIHYCAATEHCAGGRDDSGIWSDVECPDCLRSRPEEETDDDRALQIATQIRRLWPRLCEGLDDDQILRVVYGMTFLLRLEQAGR